MFGVRVEGEGFDSVDLSLPWGQDAVIDAVASVNPNTVVVLETGNPVTMPWHDKVKSVVQAWYPGRPVPSERRCTALAATQDRLNRVARLSVRASDSVPR